MTEDNRNPEAKRKAVSRKKRTEEQALWDKHTKLKSMPAHINEAFDEESVNLSGGIAQEPWERARKYFVKHDLGDGENAEPYFDTERITVELTNKATASKSKKKALDKSELKNRYPGLWGKWGMAKVIVSLEADDGTEINVRTIQRYFKEDRKKSHN